MAGKIIYPSGSVDQITYVFPKNPDYELTAGERINLNDDQRAFDGTLLRYAGPVKKKYTLTFSYVTAAQKDYFLSLWDFQCPIDLYMDGTNLDATVLMMESPAPQSMRTSSPTWSFDVILEEV
jgi:hypothetical protein